MLNRLPSWFRQELPDLKTSQVQEILSKVKVHTVCREAKCPNISNCFKNKQLTFLILGNSCTRNCSFCNVTKSESGNLGLDLLEPERVAKIVGVLGLSYVVITSVTRDDLVDGGAKQFAKTVEMIHDLDKDIKVEVLIPDFKASRISIKTILNSRPTVIAHNIETVPRLYLELKPEADYKLSLKVLSMIKETDSTMVTKSSLMLGLGEEEDEVITVMKDLRISGCDILTLGQYLAPSLKHYPVKEFIHPGKFQEYSKIALGFGFRSILSGPCVRSSYQAEQIYQELAYV
ncbi:MAG: lipoyl synthase [Candidatus Omnitrophica bacterium]|nr:lipoyl synthase [Candidatus Omnitrophota bacterium]